MVKLKIIAWNIHGAANFDKKYEMPDFVAEMIISMKADIIVLTEYIKNDSSEKLYKKLQAGYFIFEFYEEGKNGVFMGIRRDIKGLNVDLEKDNKELISSFNEDVDFLQANISINDKPISIVGSRVRIKLNGSKEEKSNCKQKQYDKLSNYSKELGSNFIMIGDLNARGTWLKKNIEFNGGEVHVIEGNSYYWMNYGNLAGAPLDNCISKGLTFLNSEYIWDFREIEENKDVYYNKEGRLALPVRKSYPDHAILVTNFEV